jgi:hypothetical protein
MLETAFIHELHKINNKFLALYVLVCLSTRQIILLLNNIGYWKIPLECIRGQYISQILSAKFGYF